MRGITVAFVAAATYAGASAKADVITFEGFFPATYVTQTMLYQAGYTLVYTPNDPFGLNGFPYGFAVIGDPPYSTACGPTPCSTNGTYAFYSFNTGSLTISATDGRPISISALDAAQTFTENNWSLDFTVTGRTETGSTVSQEFVTSPGGADAFQTFRLTTAGFTDLASVTIAGVGFWPTTQFAVDNIVVSGGEVPEPATWTMMLTGVLGLGIVRARRRSVARRLP